MSSSLSFICLVGQSAGQYRSDVFYDEKKSERGRIEEFRYSPHSRGTALLHPFPLFVGASLIKGLQSLCKVSDNGC